MALQLAYHKMHNTTVATYETASTRLFLRGRTEVIRTLSEPSWRWVQAMRDGKTEVCVKRGIREFLRLLETIPVSNVISRLSSMSCSRQLPRHTTRTRVMPQRAKDAIVTSWDSSS